MPTNKPVLIKKKMILHGFKANGCTLKILCAAPDTKAEREKLITECLKRDTSNKSVIFVVEGYCLEAETPEEQAANMTKLILPAERKIIAPNGEN